MCSGDIWQWAFKDGRMESKSCLLCGHDESESNEVRRQVGSLFWQRLKCCVEVPCKHMFCQY